MPRQAHRQTDIARVNALKQAERRTRETGSRQCLDERGSLLVRPDTSSGTDVSKTGRKGPQTIPTNEIQWAMRHLTNQMHGTIHTRLWPLWGTPSTHLFWQVAGSISPGG